MLKQKLLFLVLIVSSLISCGKDVLKYTEYEIKKGHHSSVIRFNTLTSNTLEFDAIFNESSKYQSNNEANQWDINKLYGFSECNTQHHNNSARFGWRWLDGNLEIHAYVYNDGERYTKFINNANLNQVHSYSIEIKEKSYIFRMDDNIVIMDRTNKCDVGGYYMLYPYFGGDEKAPHDITIQIREKNTR